MDNSDNTYDLKLLERSLAAWHASPALRTYYTNLFQDLASRMVEGASVEIGSGIGRMREVVPDLFTTDVVKTPYVDGALSAYALHEAGRRWANILAMDVLHHLTDPMRFFASAAGSLNPGGRILLAEPAATPLGRVFYRLCHHEPCHPAAIVPPFRFHTTEESGEFANMGMGYGLFIRHRAEVESRIREMGLQLHELRFRDLIAYPLTGGFSRTLPTPARFLQSLLAAEKWIPQGFLQRFGLRVLIILQKAG